MKNTYNAADEAALTASRFVRLWAAHEDALERHSIRYLDNLLDEIVDQGPIDTESLITKLYNFVPGLLRGTARRLVDLKFGNPQPSEILAIPMRNAA